MEENISPHLVTPAALPNGRRVCVQTSQVQVRPRLSTMDFLSRSPHLPCYLYNIWSHAKLLKGPWATLIKPDLVSSALAVFTALARRAYPIKLSRRPLPASSRRALVRWPRTLATEHFPPPHRPLRPLPPPARPAFFCTMSESQSWWSGPPPADDSPGNTQTFESQPLDNDALAEIQDEKLLTRRVHVLGLGSIGTLVAHSLKCLPNPPPVTLMLHRPEMHEKFKQNGRLIRLINKQSEVNDEQTGYDLDLLQATEDGQPYWTFEPHAPFGHPENPIEPAETLPSEEIFISTLVAAVKGPATVSAMRSIKHRVDSRSTICFMQNGLGQIDELNREVFTDPETRPTYMLGIVSHGCYMSGQFTVMHAGFGTIALGIHRDLDRYPLPRESSMPNLDRLSLDEKKMYFPTDKDLFSSLSSRYLLRTLTRSPVLACAAFPYLDLLQLQLEKLSANAIMNPLTALLNIPNGALLHNGHLSVVQRLLLAEISLVIRSLPELKGIPNVRKRFSASRLEHLLLGITSRTARNSSSMREDVRFAKETEIDYINGYIVRRGEEQGIKCALNYMLMHLIKGKSLTQINAEGVGLPYGVARVQARPSSAGIVTLDDQSIPARGDVQ